MSLNYWIIFNVFVVLMLLLDLLVFNKKDHVVKIKEALGWSAFWIGLALAFNAFIYYEFGKDMALEFLTGYLIEKSLSVDNLFVFLIIFSYFKVDPKYQHRVLFWGILGALISRAFFILAGVQLIEQFHFTLYIMGAFLVYLGIKLVLEKEKEFDPGKNPVLRLVNKLVPVTNEFHKERFFIRKEGKLFATPMLLVLVIIETTDIVFAVDSIPAILAVSKHPFIVYTSNIFAILGLRALFFALSGIMQIFHYLKYGLSVILVFIGMKILIADFYHINILVSLSFVGGTLLLSILASLIFPAKVTSEPKHESVPVAKED